MKRIISILAMLAMLLSLCTGAAAANTLEGQAKDANPSVLYYDAKGARVNNATSLGGDAMVRVSKTIESTGTENEFYVTLDVSTTQDIRLIGSGKADAATMLIIDASSSMNYCADHGSSCKKGHATRIEKAKENAITLLEEFAKLDKENGGHRYMAIVAYNSGAYTVMDWLDVASAANLVTAKEYINAISLNRGTNIEAGLMLGANVWNHPSVENIDYKYTILLSDGQPTRYVAKQDTTSRDEIDPAPGSTTTNTQAVEHVPVEATRIKNLSGISKLYSIVIGSEADKTLSPVGKTVIKWMSDFSSAAYKALTEIEMYSSFQSIISQIQLAAQAWKVDDVMGPYAVFVEEKKQSGIDNKFSINGNALRWDVLGSDPVSTTSLNNNGGVQMEYKFVYKVKLDNLNTNYHTALLGGDAWTDANESAKLTYAVLDNSTGLWSQVNPVQFPVPKMQGYVGNYSFKKVYLSNNEEKPLAGMKFQLIPTESSKTGTTFMATAESDEDGMVSFPNIPSGHTYTLVEINAGEMGYTDPDDETLTVSLGKVTGGVAGGKMVNEKQEKHVDLEVSKVFKGLDAGVRPKDIIIEVTHGAHKHTVVLNEDNRWTAKITGLQPDVEYTITEKHADVEGYHLNGVAGELDDQTLNVTNGSVKATLTVEGENSHQTHKVKLTNTYAKQVGSVKVTKLFKERTGLDADNKPVTELLDPSLYAGKSVGFELRNVDSGKSYSITLPNNGSWSFTQKNIEVGTYAISEPTRASIDNHEFIHLHILKDGQVVENDQVEITDGTEIELVLENHYLHLVGDIQVIKEFSLSGAPQGYTVNAPEDHVFKVAVYDRWTTNGGVHTPVGNAVTTIDVTKRDDGVWMGTSDEIAIGEYLLVEVESTQALDGYTFTGQTFTNQIVEVKHGVASAHVTLENHYALITDDLTISKLVDSALKSDFDKRFIFDVVFSDSSLTHNFAAKVVSANGAKRDMDVSVVDGAASITLKHDEKMTISGLPEGLGVTITEQAAEGFVSTETKSNTNVFKGEIGAKDEATFVNTRSGSKAALTVSKTVAGNAAKEEDEFTFEVKIEGLVDGQYGDMMFVGGVASITLKHGEKATAKGIPAGVSYTVTETDHGVYTPNVIEYTGVLSANGFEAAFVNTLDLPELPQTGDKSSLLLWSALLAMTGAAMLMLRKRVRG